MTARPSESQRVALKVVDDDYVADPPAYAGELWLSAKGGLVVDSLNVKTLLLSHPDLKGVVVYDEFARTISIAKSPPWKSIVQTLPRQWEAVDDIHLCNWISQQYSTTFSVEVVRNGVTAAAYEQTIHPVREYLAGLPAWDRVYRVNTWLTTYAGATVTLYTSKIGRWWLMSAVARVLHPGCKADYVLIAEGAQGRRKSTMFAELLPSRDYFLDSPIDIGEKDGAQVLRGRWIVELQELDSMGRKDASACKQYFSQRDDTYRPSYARDAIKILRQNVFCGSVNLDTYLRDETGNRRYWGFKVGETIDIEGLQKDRDQIWAEALHLYNSGAKWYPVSMAEHTMCSGEQDKRYNGGEVWQGPVEHWIDTEECKIILARNGYLTIDDILGRAIRIPQERWLDTYRPRVGKIMTSLDWKPFYPRSNGRRVTYKPPA